MLNEQAKEDLLYHYRNECDDDLREAEFWSVLECIGCSEEFKHLLDEQEV